MQPKLSIVIPAYNEAKRIGATLDSIRQFAQQAGYAIEVIVAVNNTSDNTNEVVDGYKAAMPYLQRIDCGMHHSSSGTKGLAVKAGVLMAQGEYVLYMDADSATKISEIEKFWPWLEKGNEIAFGSRYIRGAHTHRVWYRDIMGKASNLLVQALLLPGIKDTQCGFKCLTNKAAKDIFSEMETVGWGFDMEVLALGRKKGYRMKEVPVVWQEIGESSVKSGAFLAALRELLILRKRLKGTIA